MNDRKKNNSEKTKRNQYETYNEIKTSDQNTEQQLNFPHERPKRETILKYYNGII